MTKLTSLTAINSVDSTDELYLVNDPSGIPASRKITGENLKKSVLGLYKIVPSISTNALVVALRDVNGNIPSATNPVYINVNNSIRKVSSPLYGVVNPGANFEVGSADLATKEVDLFVYIAWKASTGVPAIGIARNPFCRTYADFSSTANNDKYGPFWTGESVSAGLASTDEVVVIGRIAVINSGTASYNWSIPTITSKNVISCPIYNTRVLTWTPSFVNLTVGNGTSVGYYQIIGARCIAQMSFILGSTTSISGSISNTLPIRRTTPYYAGGGAGPILGIARVGDTGTATYTATMLSAALNTVSWYANNASTTYTSILPMSATVPMTWATTDTMDMWLDYYMAEL